MIVFGCADVGGCDLHIWALPKAELCEIVRKLGGQQKRHGAEAWKSLALLTIYHSRQ